MRKPLAALLLAAALLTACSDDSDDLDGGDGAVGGTGTSPVQEDGAANQVGGADDEGS